MKSSPAYQRLLATKLPSGPWRLEYRSSSEPFKWHPSSLGGQLRRLIHPAAIPPSPAIEDSIVGRTMNLPTGLWMLIRYTIDAMLKYRLRNVRTGEILSQYILEPRRLMPRPTCIAVDDDHDNYWAGGIVSYGD